MKKLFNLYDSRLGWVALLGLILLLPGQALAGKNAFKLLDDVESTASLHLLTHSTSTNLIPVPTISEFSIRTPTVFNSMSVNWSS